MDTHPHQLPVWNPGARKARGGVLALQVAWPLAALLSIFLLVVSLPIYFHQRSQICPSPCEIYGGITEADRPRMEATGLTLNGYAGYLTVLQAISVPLFFFLFPDGRFVPGWTRWAVIAWILMNSTRFFPDSALNLSRYEVLDAAQWILILLLAILLLAVGSQLYRYRWVSESVQRQQTKWVVIGTWIWVLISLPMALSRPPPGSLVFLLPETLSAALLWLLSISIAMLRYRLWDVDLIIRRTLVYSILTALLALTFFGSVAILDSLLASLSGPRSQIAIVLSTLGIAALFTPLRGRVQNLIDRRFYRRKYDAEKALASSSRGLRDEIDLENLTHALLMVVHDTLEPSHVTCWLRTQTDDH